MWHNAEISKIFQDIITEYGYEVFSQRKKISALCADLFLQYERESKVFRMLFNEGLGDYVGESHCQTIQQQNRSILNIKKFLEDRCIAADDSDNIILIFKESICAVDVKEEKAIDNSFQSDLGIFTSKLSELKEYLFLLSIDNVVSESINEYYCSVLADLTKDGTLKWEERNVRVNDDVAQADYYAYIDVYYIGLSVKMAYQNATKVKLSIQFSLLAVEGRTVNYKKRVERALELYKVLNKTLPQNQLKLKCNEIISKKKEQQNKVEEETRSLQWDRLRRQFQNGMPMPIERIGIQSDITGCQYTLKDFTPPNRVKLGKFEIPDIKKMMIETKQELIYWQYISSVYQGRFSKENVYRTLYDGVYFEATILQSEDKYGGKTESTTIRLIANYYENLERFTSDKCLSTIKESARKLKEKVLQEEKDIEAEKATIWFSTEDKYYTHRLREVKKEKTRTFDIHKLFEIIPDANIQQSLYDIYYSDNALYEKIRKSHSIDSKVNKMLKEQKNKLLPINFKLRYALQHKIDLLDEDYVLATEKALIKWCHMEIVDRNQREHYYEGTYQGCDLFRVKARDASSELKTAIENRIGIYKEKTETSYTRRY